MHKYRSIEKMVLSNMLKLKGKVMEIQNHRGPRVNIKVTEQDWFDAVHEFVNNSDDSKMLVHICTDFHFYDEMGVVSIDEIDESVMDAMLAHMLSNGLDATFIFNITSNGDGSLVLMGVSPQ